VAFGEVFGAWFSFERDASDPVCHVVELSLKGAHNGFLLGDQESHVKGAAP
jgi:hypothetical protein